MRGLVFTVALLAACHRAAPSKDPPIAGVAGSPAEVAARDAAFDDAVARLATRRAALARAFADAPDAAARARIRDDARAELLTAVREELFPAWLGTPWGLGKTSTARRPHEPGMTVGCSYFVTAILGNAGFRLDNRYTFARAPALDIQRSLATDDGAVRRFLSIPARDLERKVAALGDGLWLIGLSNHIAFVDITDGAVQLVHASWSNGEVSDEPLVTARAIDVSRKAGYFVSPVVVPGENDALIDAWLAGTTIRFRS